MAGGADRVPIGRERELAAIDAAFDAARSGTTRGVIVVAPPGIGKTILLRHASHAATSSGMHAAFARTPLGAPPPPLHPLGALLDGLIHSHPGPIPDRLTEIVRDLDERRAAPSLPHLSRSLDEICAQGPIALIVDDIHLVTAEGLAFLLGTVRSLEHPCVLLLASRPEGPDSPDGFRLPESSADLMLERLDLRPLDEAAAGRIAEMELGAPLLPSSIAHIHQATAGHPLHLIETLRLGRAEGWLESVGGHITITEAFKPRPVLGAIGARLRRLTAEQLDVASAIASFGRAASLDEIASATGRDAAATLDEIVRLGIATADGAPSMFRLSHPLHAVACEDLAGPARLSHLHGAILATLRQRSNVPAEELAHHALRADHPPDDLATLIRDAAHEAERTGSPGQAAEWWSRLARLAPDVATIREAVSGQARATVSFDPAAAAALYTRAIEGTTGTLRARLLVDRALAYRRLGRTSDDVRDLEEALPIADPDQLFSIRTGIAIGHLLRGRRDEARTLIDALVAESVNTDRAAAALRALAVVQAYSGDVEGLIESSQRCVASATDPRLIRSATNNAIWGLMLTGRWDEAEARATTAIAEAESAGDLWNLLPVVANSALLSAWRGDIARALDFAVRSERLATKLGNPMDRLKAVECTAVALLEAGNAADAATLLTEVRDILSRHAEAREINYTYVVMGDVHLALGDRAGARMFCDAARHLLDTDSLIWASATDRLRAQIALAEHDPGRASAIVEPWLERPGPVALEQVRLAETHARAAVALGGREEGFAALERARDAYAALGARRAAESIDTWLFVRRRRPVGRPRSSLAGGLTEREHEILELIVEGLTNKEIAARLVIGASTVKKHVERIREKSGLSRRVELVSYAIGLGITPAARGGTLGGFQSHRGE